MTRNMARAGRQANAASERYVFELLGLQGAGKSTLVEKVLVRIDAEPILSRTDILNSLNAKWLSSLRNRALGPVHSAIDYLLKRRYKYPYMFSSAHKFMFPVLLSYFEGFGPPADPIFQDLLSVRTVDENLFVSRLQALAEAVMIEAEAHGLGGNALLDEGTAQIVLSTRALLRCAGGHPATAVPIAGTMRDGANRVYIWVDQDKSTTLRRYIERGSEGIVDFPESKSFWFDTMQDEIVNFVQAVDNDVIHLKGGVSNENAEVLVAEIKRRIA